MKKIFLYLIVVLALSFSVFAASPGMDRAMDALSTVAEFEIEIPHPGYGSSEEVNIWLVAGVVLVLYYIFYSLTGMIGFLNQEEKARKGLGIGLTLVSVFAAPLIEFISAMFQMLFGFGYILGLVGVAALLFLGFMGIISLAKKGASQIENYSKQLDKSVDETSDKVQEQMENDDKEGKPEEEKSENAQGLAQDLADEVKLTHEKENKEYEDKRNNWFKRLDDNEDGLTSG